MEFRTNGIDIKRLLMIGRDNPNVNKAIEKLIDAEMEKVGGELLKIGSCHIHVIHNAFKSGKKPIKRYLNLPGLILCTVR